MLILEKQKHVDSGKCFKWRTRWKLCPNESQLSSTTAFQQLHWTHPGNKLCTNDTRHVWFSVIWKASPSSCSHGFQVQSKDPSQTVSTCCRMWTTTSGSEPQTRQKRWGECPIEVDFYHLRKQCISSNFWLVENYHIFRNSNKIIIILWDSHNIKES